MKYLLIVCFASSAILSGAANCSKKSLWHRHTAEDSSPEYALNDLPKNSSKNRKRRSRKIVNPRKEQPKSIRAERIVRSKSNPEQLNGPLMLLDEVAEAFQPVRRRPLREGGAGSSRGSMGANVNLDEDPDLMTVGRGMLSPRSLVRVASLSNCDKAMSDREEKKLSYRAKLTPLEQRIFDAVGLKNLEFIKKQPGLLQVLDDAPGDEINSWYQAYLRSTVIILQEKLAGKRAVIKNLNPSSTITSPRDNSPDVIAELIAAERKDDLSPRNNVLGQIKIHLAQARKERDMLIGQPVAVEQNEAVPNLNRNMAFASSSRL